jgi:hypothetical protein
LSEIKGKIPFITIRAEKACVVKGPSSSTLYVKLDENLEVLTTSGERTKHFKEASGWLDGQLESLKDPSVSEVAVATPQHRLEVITGDVVPILSIGGKGYLVNYYRDIPPLGWLFPGGCSQNIDEILNPKLTACREGGEEVIVRNTRNGEFYSLFPTTKGLEAGIRRWGFEPKRIVFLPGEEIFFPDRGDAQNLVIVTPDGKEFKTENIYVSIDPETASVAATMFWKVHIPCDISDLMILDGEFNEKSGSLIRRAARLTPLKGDISLTFFPDGFPLDIQKVSAAGWMSRAKEKIAKF